MGRGSFAGVKIASSDVNSRSKFDTSSALFYEDQQIHKGRKRFNYEPLLERRVETSSLREDLPKRDSKQTEVVIERERMKKYFEE